MKGMILIAALAAFALTGTTACNVDADFSGTYSVDNISVAPGEWKNFGVVGTPDFYTYADIHIPELTASVLRDGAYLVYYKYLGPDDNGNNTVPVQELLPVEVFEDGWSYRITPEVSEGNLRLVVRTSDYGLPRRFDQTMFFRLAIIR
jgi:hypothetical protein